MTARKPSAAQRTHVVKSTVAYPGTARPWVAILDGIALTTKRGRFRRFASPGAAERAGWAASRATPAGREAARHGAR